GWTLAFQMGIKFDRILDEFDGPFQALPYGELQSPPSVRVVEAPEGYLLDARTNNSYSVANLLLQKGVKLRRLTKASGVLPSGSFYVPAKARVLLEQAVADSGVEPVPAPNLDLMSASVGISPA